MDAKNLHIIDVERNSLDKEHICCGFPSARNQRGYEKKKELMAKRFEEGYRFKKFDFQDKAFIEYVPAEYSWTPIDAPGYMFINCFSVSGRIRNHGMGNRLLEQCIAESEEMNGIVLVSSDKKKPFLADKKFFIKKGFEVFDIAPPYFELLGIKFRKDANDPLYLPLAKQKKIKLRKGLTIYYTHQCPFTEYYAKQMAKQAGNIGVESRVILVESNEEARKIPSGYGIFNVFYKGKFLTHEMMGEKKFVKLLSSVKDLW